jgi:hypothetical protein
MQLVQFGRVRRNERAESGTDNRRLLVITKQNEVVVKV